jgi:hypothetical protein
MSLAVNTVGTWSRSRWSAVAAISALHAAALLTLLRTETDLFHAALFALVWGLFNALWLVAFARPALSAALSLAAAFVIIALSQFKYDTLWMTIDFFDVLVIDPDTFRFLLAIVPGLQVTVAAAVLVAIPAAFLLWRLDPFRVRRLTAVAVGAGCFVGIVALGLAKPREPSEAFFGINHLSGFAHSGVSSVPVLLSRGWLESDATASGGLRLADDDGCRPAVRPPHILLVLDESSFDIRMAPGIKVPPGYGDHFRSLDGRQRALLVEGAGGPTWYTEYNILAGLSARSYGRFAYQVTRIAAGKVERGLPRALQRCGYRTFSLYPAHNAFLSARRFQQGTGVGHVLDARDMKQGAIEPDSFFYDQALRLIGRERASGDPLFLFVYTQANHFPWTFAYRPESTPDWRAPGNGLEIDEYLRRQAMSARDYRDFVARLKREHPEERFLIVRFGDHQPPLAARIVDPKVDEAVILRRVMAGDPRYLTTYYAIDAVNFDPVDLSSAFDGLDAPYLPIAILEAAGLPLDATFREQKRIMERCMGLFALCAGGAEARRFNRLLIDAGLIKGL